MRVKGVEEVANLAIGAIDVNRRTILVEDGKGAKDRIVYMSNDALHALAADERQLLFPSNDNYFSRQFLLI